MKHDDLNMQIGRKLKEIRKKKGLNLDQTAAITGVSKPMLGQIERGVSNPTVGTLWKIANGLHVAFSSFIDADRPPVQHVVYENLEVLEGDHGGFHVKPVISKDLETPFEVYYVALDPYQEYHSFAHPAGVEEYLFLKEGALEVQIGEKSYSLKRGDALRFKAHHDHVYKNKTKETSHFTMIIYYS